LELEALLKHPKPSESTEGGRGEGEAEGAGQEQADGQGRVLLYGEYKRSPCHCGASENLNRCSCYLHRRQLFLAHDSFKNWIVDDPETSEMFPLSYPVVPLSSQR
jgi:hypothetical protein